MTNFYDLCDLLPGIIVVWLFINDVLKCSNIDKVMFHN